MIKKKFILVKKSKKLLTIKRTIFYSIILVIILFIYFLNHSENHTLKLVYVYSLLLWVLLNFISGFFINSYKKIGKLSFFNNKISFIDISAELTNIERIIIHANDYQGEAHKGMYLGIGVAYPKAGIDNHIELFLKNKKNNKFRILFKYKNDINIIFKIFSYYQSNGINIDFYKKGEKIL